MLQAAWITISEPAAIATGIKNQRTFSPSQSIRRTNAKPARRMSVGIAAFGS